MNIEHLLREKPQAREVPTSEHLLQPKKLPGLIDYFLTARESELLSPKTISIYRDVLNRFAKSCQNDTVTSQDVRNYLLSLHVAGLKPHSIHIHYRSIKTFFNWLTDDGLDIPDIMKHVKAPKLDKIVIKPFTEQDFDDIVLVCSGNRFVDVRNRAMVSILYDSGIRLQELAELTLGSISPDKEIITVKGKGNKERRVKIGINAKKALHRYMIDREGNYSELWLTESQTPMTYWGVKIAIRRIIERAGIKGVKIGAHTFRHTAATGFIRNGGNIYVLQEMLGHTDQATTRKYCSSIGIEQVIEEHIRCSPLDNYMKRKKK